MSVNVEKLEGNKVKLKFEVDKEEFVKAIDSVYTKNARQIVIPGFRKGKVPKAMVEKYYGETIFYQDAFDEIANNEYGNAIKENNLKVIDRPEIDVEKMSKEEGIVFTAIVEVEPEIELGKYKGIEIEKVEYNVTDKDIENKLNQMASENARIINVEDKALENGDISIIDFEGFIDDVAFDGGKGENHELEIGSGQFIPGFEEQLIGMKIGEEKEIIVKFPDDYHVEEFKGKDAKFKVKLNEIKIKELPKIDDEFAKDVSEFDSLKDLKADVEAKLKKESENKEKAETETKAIEKLLEETKIDVPQAMVNSEVDQKIEEIKHNMKHQGIEFEMYLQMLGQKLDDVKISLEEQATKDIKIRLILEAIIVKEAIEVTDEDVDKKIEEMAKLRNVDVEEMKKTFNDNIKNYYKENMKYEKALKFVIDNAKIK